MTTEALIWTLAGVGIGLSAASRVVRVLSALIYGIEGTDPIVYAAIILLLPGVALTACWVPAWRASRTSPAETLRGI